MFNEAYQIRSERVTYKCYNCGKQLKKGDKYTLVRVKGRNRKCCLECSK